MTSSESSPRPPSFSQKLHDLAAHFAERPVKLIDLMTATQDQGLDLLLVFLVLPFLVPLPLPGLSTLLGLAIAVLGGCLAMGIQAWIPQKLLHRELPARFFPAILRAASKIVRLLEYFLRPRLIVFNEQYFFRRMAGVLIAISGFYLLLPLPIPLSNTFPAWTVMLLAAGALERDGLFFLAGCVLFVAATVFFSFLAFEGASGVEHLHRLIIG